MTDDDRFITIRHFIDPVQAEMVKALLAEEGIPATIQGNHHNALFGGALGVALSVPLQVPASRAEQARAILDALDDYEPAPDEVPDEPEDERGPSIGDGPYRAARVPAPPPRKKHVAVAAAICLPMMILAFGAGHFYVHAYGRGVVLLIAALTLLYLGFGGLPWAFFGVPLVVLLDAIGAVGVIAARDRA